MDFSNIFFSKSIEDKDFAYSDVVDFFIEEKEESTRIEFKSFSEKYGNFEKNLEGVIRGITAFLNSEGGVLIWGAPEGTEDKTKKTKIFKGELSPLKEYKDKDRLISKISDQITPLPVGIKVAILQDSDNIVYVFEIQQSKYAPHSYKNTYYARLDGQTKPAPHYLIEALFRQIRFPNVEGYIAFKQVLLDNSNPPVSVSKLEFDICIFNFSELQKEENVFFRLISTGGILSGYKSNPDPAIYAPEYKGKMRVESNYEPILFYGQPLVISESIEITDRELRNSNNKISIVLIFGGKHSPLRTSEYELNVEKVEFGTLKGVNRLIISQKENVLFSEKQKELGSSRESILKAVLRRDEIK